MISSALFGDHAAQVAGVVHGLVDHLLGELVELLDRFPLDVRRAGRPQEVEEPRLVHLLRDDLGGQGHVVEQVAQGSGRLRVLALLVDDVSTDRGDAGVVHVALRGSVFGRYHPARCAETDARPASAVRAERGDTTGHERFGTCPPASPR